MQDLAPDAIELLQTIEATRDLPIRLRMSPWYVPGAPLEEVSRLAELQGVHGRRWIVEGVKLMIDGTVDNGTAWLHEPDCLGESTTSLWLDPEQYRDALTELDRRGIPTTTHAIGDAGIDFVVRAIDGLGERTATHRIEHIETMTDAALEVFVSSRATASMQPTHCTLFTRADGSDNWSRRLGEERADRGFRTRDLVRAGIPLALGSDWPVAPSDAVGILADAQLRRPHDEPDAVPINPSQALNAMEALRGLTVEPYRTIGQNGRCAARRRPGGHHSARPRSSYGHARQPRRGCRSADRRRRTHRRGRRRGPTVTLSRKRVVIITGAGSEHGIGFAAARLLGAGGMRVVLTSTTGRIFDRVDDECRRTGVDRYGVSVRPRALMGAATPSGAPEPRRRSRYVIAFLAGDGASYITGQLITVDGANSISEERGR